MDTAQIETASLQRDRGFIGTRYFTDDYAFEPYRARVKAGTTVTWRNNSRMVHTIVAQDGSWTTGPLSDGAVGAQGVRQARDVHLHLQGTSVGLRADRRRRMK